MLRLVVICFLVLCAPLGHAQKSTKETVFWHISSFPPYYILSEPDRGKGVVDKLIRTMIARMPEFNHEIVEAASARTNEGLTSKASVCAASRLKTAERVAMWPASETYLGLMPNGVITTRKRLESFSPYLNERGELLLDQFLTSGKFRLGINTSRSYDGGTVDALLKKHVSQLALVPATDEISSRLLKLMNQNEFQAIIGYSIELKQTTRELKLNEKDFAFLPIAESSALLPMAVFCSNSPLGKQIIQSINRVLAEKGIREDVEASYRSWLDDETAQRYTRLLKERSVK